MAILKAPPKQPKSAMLQVRVEEALKQKLEQYAEFIDVTPSYVVSEALRLLFRKDREFKKWASQQAANGDQPQFAGDSRIETAKIA